MKRLLGRGPVPQAYAAATSGTLRVLAYHGAPRADTFSRQLDLLLQDYHVISLAEVEASLAGAVPLEPRSVLITFDDGDRSVHDVAAPMLRRARVPAVVYVVTALVDTEKPFWWDEAVQHLIGGGRSDLVGAATPSALLAELKALPDDRRREALRQLAGGSTALTHPQLTSEELRQLTLDGIVIGNHTMTHPCLDRCDAATTRTEIEQAHARLTEILGEAPTSFAYPNGNLDLEAERVLRELEYRSAFLFDHRIQRLPTEPLRVSRLRVNSEADVDTFRLLVSGAHSFVHHRVLRRR